MYYWVNQPLSTVLKSMPKEKPKPNELVVKGSRTRKLAYTPEFKENLPPTAIKEFLKLAPKLRRKETLEGANIVVTHFDDSWGGVRYYKVVLGDKDFFVKRIPARFSEKGGGFGEAVASEKMRSLLREHKIENVEVIDFQLGYEDKSDRYFVAKWSGTASDRLLNLFVYENDLVSQIQNLKYAKASISEIADTERELDKIRSRENKLTKFFEQTFNDFGSINMAYDPQSKKIILFDLYLKSK